MIRARVPMPSRAGALVIVAMFLPAVAMTGLSCGYEPLYSGGTGPPLAVVTPVRLAPDVAAASEIEAGARGALARAGRLRGGAGYPRLALELLRIDDNSEGISAVGGAPLARATRVAVVGRGWIEQSAELSPLRDSGDVRAVETIATDSDLRLEALRRGDAVRAAARRLGDRLGRFALGEPIAPDESM